MDETNQDIDVIGHGSFGKLILRLTVGILMLFHGAAKITNPGSLEYIRGKVTEIGLPPEVYYGVFAGEIVAPLMIIFGLFARLGGLIVAINMVFAVVLVHMGELLARTETGAYQLETQALFLFGGLAILFIGSGRIAVRPD